MQISNTHIKNNNKTKKGGRVIASGGFGCVFSPALKCKGTKKRELGKITKLTKEKYAIQEYEEINKFKNKLDDIKDYKNYFLIDDITLCKPDKLTSDDLLKYTKKCTALKKDKITKDNINKNLDKIMALNIPNGGIPVDDYLYEDGSFEKISKINIKLKDLLKYGVVPMNERNIYHCDLKESNVLVAEYDNDIKTRIIDWGLATEYIPNNEEPFPKTWRNRPLQYNVPFSVIIFTDSFVNKYTEYIKDGGKLEHDSLKPFVINYLHYWIHERGAGHYKFINDIMYILFGEELTTLSGEDKKKIIETEFTIPYIINYIIEILVHFTEFRKNGTLNLRIYLDNVFIKIVDKWGFITIYYPILELLNANYDKLTDSQMKIYNSIKYMFIEYLYKPRIEPININHLYKHLENLEFLIKDVINESSKISGITAKGISRTKKQSIKNRKSNISFKKMPNKSRKFNNKKLLMISSKLKKNNTN